MKTSCVIVTYNPEITMLKQNVNALINQVDLIIVVDNCSKNIEDVKSLEQLSSKIMIESLDKNYGLGYALQYALEYSHVSGYEWILTMDQDSLLDDQYIENMKNVIINHDEDIYLIGPEILDRNKNEVESNQKYGVKKVATVITSGCVMNVQKAIEVGGFDVSFFIDHLDNDLCFSFLEHGYDTYMTDAVSLDHSLGEITYHRFLFKKFFTTNHSAFRVFYIYRNFFWMKRKHKKLIRENMCVRKWFLRKKMSLLLLRPFKILFYEKQSFSKLKAMSKGICAKKK